jgi:hypothetical protein
MDATAFARKVAEARDGVFRRAVHETEILQAFEGTYETIPERKPGFKRPYPG